jgi:hypothetical protein
MQRTIFPCREVWSTGHWIQLVDAVHTKYIKGIKLLLTKLLLNSVLLKQEKRYEQIIPSYIEASLSLSPWSFSMIYDRATWYGSVCRCDQLPFCVFFWQLNWTWGDCCLLSSILLCMLCSSCRVWFHTMLLLLAHSEGEGANGITWLITHVDTWYIWIDFELRGVWCDSTIVFCKMACPAW